MTPQPDDGPVTRDGAGGMVLPEIDPPTPESRDPDVTLGRSFGSTLLDLLPKMPKNPTLGDLAWGAIGVMPLGGLLTGGGVRLGLGLARDFGTVTTSPDLNDAAEGAGAAAGKIVGLLAAAVGVRAAIRAAGGGGKVYRVDGSKTPSGKPCIGRTKQSSPKARGSRDGRDRSGAEIVDTYDGADTGAGRRAEQRAINREGGVGELDNLRNEIRPDKWEQHGIPPPE